MVFDILNTAIALSCPVRFQILADIESFAFLFLSDPGIINSMVEGLEVFYGVFEWRMDGV